MRKLVGAVTFFLGIPLLWAAVAPLLKVENHEELRKMYGLSPAYDNVRGLERMKVAVFDQGFGGVSKATMSQYLPEDTKIIDWQDDPRALPLDNGDPHGRLMAQTLWAMTGLSNDGPEMFLVNARGTFNFKKAHNWAIREGVDVVLISMNFEGTGNFDGGGEINQMVNAMTADGILVVVAAGNYGGMVHNSPIQINRSNNVVFQTKQGNRDYLEFTSRITEDPASPNRPPLKIVLIWNDYTDRPDTGTDRDLDLYLTNERGEVLAKREMKQVLQKSADSEANQETFSAREALEYNQPLVAGQKFRIQVKMKSQSRFNANSDRLRIVLLHNRNGFFDDAEQKDVNAIEFPDASLREEIMVPADNPNVITVGALSPFSAKGPTMRPIEKPDVYLPLAQVKFGQAEPPQVGTSYAAAMFAGMVTVMKASSPNLERNDILKLVALAKPEAPREVSWDEAIRDLPSVMNEVARSVRGTEAKVRVSEGRLLVEVDHFPEPLKHLFKGIDWSRLENPFESYEFYLTGRQLFFPDGRLSNEVAVRGVPRAMVSGGNGAMASLPWEAQKENPRGFVQIILRQDPRGDNLGVDPNKIWYTTPSPEDVFRAQR